MACIIPLSFAALALLSIISTDVKDTTPTPVTGCIGDPLDLGINRSFSHSVDDVVWKRSKTKIAEVKDKNVVVHVAQFKGRLKLHKDGKGIRIENITSEDIGVYNATVTLSDHSVHYVSSNVTITNDSVHCPNEITGNRTESSKTTDVKDTTPTPVTGCIGKPLDLGINRSFSHSVDDVVWKRSKTKIAEVKDKNVVVHVAQFKGRLKLHKDGKGIRIENITSEDIGVYNATVTLSDHSVHYVSYNVTITKDTDDLKMKMNENEKKKRTESRWSLVASFIALFIFGILFYLLQCPWKKEELKLSVAETNTSISVKEKHSEEEKPLYLNTVKYSSPGFIPLHPQPKLKEHGNDLTTGLPDTSVCCLEMEPTCDPNHLDAE